MANLLANGISYLGERLTTFAGETVVVSNGSLSVSLAARPGKTTFNYEDTSGAIIQWDSVDFILVASALNFGSGPVLPQKGWAVTRANGVVCELYSPPGSEKCYRLDPTGQQLRLHTKQQT